MAEARIRQIDGSDMPKTMGPHGAWHIRFSSQLEMKRCFRWLMIVSTFLFVYGAFQIGIDRGFHRTIDPADWGRLQFGIGAAITSIAHGGHGYIVYDNISTVLAYAGLTGDAGVLASIGQRFPDNLRNESLINAAIDKAVRFQPAASKPHGAATEDPGIVDFARIGFALFGYKLHSLYLTYFFLFTISVIAILLTFRDRPGVLALVAIAAAAHLGFFASDLFDPPRFSSIVNPRALTVLAVVPGLHIGLIMSHRVPASAANVALAAIQAAIVVLAWWIRASAIWVPFGLVVLAAGILFAAAWRACGMRKSLQRVWPAGVLAGVILLHSAYVAVALDPIYGEVGDLAHHTIWHPVYYALQAHPDWRSKYGPSHDHAIGDDQPRAAVKHYLAKHPLPENQGTMAYRDTYGSLKFTEYEKYVRKAFFAFLKDDPRFVAETFLIYNPLGMFYMLRDRLVTFGSQSGNWCWLFAFAGGAILAFLIFDPVERRNFGYGAALAAGAFFMSIVPLLMTVPFVSDNLVVLVIAIVAWGLFILANVPRGITAVARHFGLRNKT